MKLFDSIKTFFQPKAKPVQQAPASFGTKPLPKDFFNLNKTPKINVQEKLSKYGSDVTSKINNDPVSGLLAGIVQAIPRAVGTLEKTSSNILGMPGLSGTNAYNNKAVFGNEPVRTLGERTTKTEEDIKKLTGKDIGPLASGALAFGGTIIDLVPGIGGDKKAVTESIDLISKSKAVDDIVPALKNIFKQARVTKTDDEILKLANKYKDIEDVKTIADDIGAQVSTLKEPSLPKTFAKNPTISDEIKNSIDQLRYKPITNIETLDEANKIVDKDINAAVTYFRDIKKPDRISNTVGQVLVKRLQDVGRIDDAIDVAVKLTDDATKAGQAVQVFNIINRLSPEGVLKYTVRSINRAGGDAKKIITPEFANKITKAAEDIQKLADGSREKQEATATLLRDIMNEVPKGLLKKVSSFQTLAQLLNPKTTVRNILGNLIFNAVENTKDVPASILDYGTSLITGTRTTSLPDLIANARGFKRGIKEGTQDAIKGINTSRSNTMYEINRQNVFKQGSALSYAEKALNVLNTSVDRGFYEAAFDGSLAKIMKAKGIKDATKITDDMIEDAAAEAAYRTFQDDSIVAQSFSRIKNALNFGKDFGIGDFIIKYPKVPGNIFARGMAYSPLGFTNTVMELGKPLIGKPFNQKRFVESTARALVGTTGLFGTGALLNKLGIITGSEKKDDFKTQNFKRELGLGKYKINVTALKRFIASGMDPEEAKLQEGDTLASYDWAQPIALSLAMGADYNENKGGQDAFINKLGNSISNISDVVISGSSSLEEQPVLRGLKNLFGGDTLGEGVGKIISGVPTSFVPTILRQFRNIIDDNARITSGNDPLTIAYRQTINALPFASKSLSGDVTTLGEDKAVFGATKNNIWNVFFNPSFVSKYKPSKEAQVVMDVFTNSGDSGSIPRRYTKYVQLGSEQKKITPEQQRAYQRFLGKLTKSSLTNLTQNKDVTINGKKFYELSDEEKASELDSLFSDINSAAKITLFGYKPKRVNKRTNGLIKFYEQNPFIHKEKGLVK